MRGPEGIFSFPRTRSGISPRWLVASLVAHAVVLAVWVETNVPRPVETNTRAPFLVLNVPAEERYHAPLPAPHPATPPPASRYQPLVIGRGVAPPLDTAGPLPSGQRRDSIGAGEGVALGGGVPGGRGRRTLADLVPSFGTGELWVPPAYLPPGGGRPIRMDSVVAVRMLALADSMERHPPADPNADPYVSRGWTFRRNGKTYGWDAAGIHFGDFTIPNVVLAFLSMPQGNIDLDRANTQLMAMRADIMRAAARAQAEADFRQAVRDIRARKQKERDLQRARDSVRTQLSP